MKKVILGLFFGFGLLIGISEATSYVPTQEDTQLISTLEEKITSIIQNDTLKRWDYVHQLIVLDDNFGTNKRITYILNEVKETLYQPLLEAKKTSAIARHIMEDAFYRQYGEAISSKDFDVPVSCFDYYDYIDTLSWIYDHPTSLTLATWFRESNCRQTGTHNAQGPFQITANHYGYDAMQKGDFLQSVQEYLEFSKGKHDWYARANGGELEVELAYDNRTLSGVVYHGALYNGLGGRNLRGEIYPAATGYVYGNFTEDYSSYSRDGVLTMMLKVMNAS